MCVCVGVCSLGWGEEIIIFIFFTSVYIISPPTPAGFLQVFDTSDVPGGVVNILTGNRDHLTRVLTEHHDVHAVWYFGTAEGSKFVEHAAAENLKRTWVSNGQDRDFGDGLQGGGEEFLFHSTQPKTVWIPMGEIFAN